MGSRINLGTHGFISMGDSFLNMVNIYDPDVLGYIKESKKSLETLQTKIINLELAIKEIASSLASTDQKKALKILRGTFKYPTRKIVRKIPSLCKAVVKSLERSKHHNYYLHYMEPPQNIPYEEIFKWWIGSKSDKDIIKVPLNTITRTLGYNKEGTIYSLLMEKRYKDTFPAIKEVRTALTGILAILSSSITSINKIIKDEEKRRDGLIAQGKRDKAAQKEEEKARLRRS